MRKLFLVFTLLGVFVALFFVLNITPSALAVEDLEITTNTLPDATVGEAYSVQLEAAGGVAPYTWSFTDTTYPDSCCILGLSGDSGLFNTQTASTVYGGHTGTYYWTFRVTDSQGETVTKTLSLEIISDLEIVTTNLPDATVGESYSTTLVASGGEAPYKWSPVSTTYHAGCCILGISGDGPIFNTQSSDTVQGPAGDYSWVLKVTDANGDSVIKTVYLTIQEAAPQMPTTATVVTSSLPSATLGSYYSARIKVSSNGDYSPNMIISGLPSGLAVEDPSPGYTNSIYATAKKDSQGYYYFDITGVPAQSGTYSVNLNVFNVNHTLDFDKTFSLSVNFSQNEPNLILSSSFVNFYYTQGDELPESYSAHIANSSSSQSLSYQISVPNQPDWLNTSYATDVLTLGPLGSAGLGVSVNPTGLSVGTYTTKINISGNFVNSPKSIDVKLVVREGLGSGSEVVHPVGTLVNINGTVYKVTPQGLVGYKSPTVLYEEGYTFDDVVSANYETAKLGVAGTANYPDGTLVNDSGTIYITEDGYKKGFTSADVFLQMGYRFENVINDDLSEYQLRGLIISAQQAHPVGTLVNDNGAVFLIGENERVGITSVEIFRSHGYSFGKVVFANSYDRALAHVRNLKFADGTLVNDNGTVYVISQGQKFGFASAEAFYSMGYRFSQVVYADVSGYPSGGIYR